MIIKASDRIKEVQTYYFAQKLKEVRAMNAQGEDVINLGIGSPDMSPPVDVIRELSQVSSRADVHAYQPYRGIDRLRVAFSEFYQRHFKVSLDSETEVLPLIGSKEGIMHISMSFLNEGDKVLVPNPGYPAYASAAKLSGAEIIHYELLEQHQYLPDMNALAEMDLGEVKIMWLNYPHMPTGAQAGIETFTELVKLAKANSILICHDNPYGFILNDKPLSFLEVEGAMDVSVELFSLSKCFNMAGWRVGALLGRSDYLDTVLRFKSQMDSGMFRPLQEAAVKALEMDPTWFSDLNQIYEGRRKLALEIMDVLGCSYQKDAAGLFIWGKVDASIKDVKLYVNEILHKAKVFLTPGEIFGSAGAGYIRLSLCSDEERLREALDRISQYKNNA